MESSARRISSSRDNVFLQVASQVTISKRSRLSHPTTSAALRQAEASKTCSVSEISSSSSVVEHVSLSFDVKEGKCRCLQRHNLDRPSLSATTTSLRLESSFRKHREIWNAKYCSGCIAIVCDPCQSNRPHCAKLSGCTIMYPCPTV